MAPDADDFSHVPIRGSDGRITAVLRRVTADDGTIVDPERVAISDAPKISASTPLFEMILRLRETDFLLVESPESGYPDGISGIITHADLQKLPVRVFLFARLSELEDRLRRVVSGTNWEHDPSCKNIKEVAVAKQKQFNGTKLPLEFQLNVKRLGEVARIVGGFCGDCDRATFDSQLSALLKVRNTIAHGIDIDMPEIVGIDGPLGAIMAANDALDWAFRGLPT